LETSDGKPKKKGGHERSVTPTQADNAPGFKRNSGVKVNSRKKDEEKAGEGEIRKRKQAPAQLK